jgi:hypothetical protein
MAVGGSKLPRAKSGGKPPHSDIWQGSRFVSDIQTFGTQVSVFDRNLVNASALIGRLT